MPIKIRPNPVIPDHEVLRKIGGGAYGEVWLARGVTGALRAIKVVWREDFEDERGFEREFEGILKFEPISRDHPALVNILHVGRSPDSTFYYYVMELGDDVTTGQDINPIEYEPRTLRADTQHAVGVQWDTNVCIDVGLRLAEALDHLHERGLAHRDVKPSNVIFVNGRAKLADIGLVAARGQRTFVGTEGFVPPEGPGSSQADVYSLGKVLYELATGKDRLAFPELPDHIPSGLDRKRWLELNKIICDICEPRISKRKISNAAELAEALRRLQRGKRRRRSGTAVWVTTLVLTGFVGWAGWELAKESPWLRGIAILPGPVVTPTVRVLVNSGPEGAEVFDAAGNFLGMSNSYSQTMKVGEEYHFMVRKSGYKPHVFEGRVEKSPPGEPQEPQQVLWKTLEIYSPPLTGEKWIDHLSNSYLPEGKSHVGSGFVRRVDWERFSRDKKIPPERAEFLSFSENGVPVDIVLSSAADAEEFGRWFYSGGYQDGNGGYLTNEHEVKILMESSFENAGLGERARRDGLKPFRILVRPIDFGQIMLTTNAPRVDVFMSPASNHNDRVSAGYTSESQLLIPKVKPGKWQIYLVAEGFKPETLPEVEVKEGEKLALTVELQKSLGVVFGKSWTNGIDMRFEPVEEELLASAWETRVGDFKRFIKEAGYNKVRFPDFAQADDHPVVNISREDAQAFCRWLTERERKEERILQTHVYRLPTDLEWSNFVGLREEAGISPGWRDARKEPIFPWGRTWTGSEPVGNFADISAAASPGISIDRTLPAYNDGFPQTAPVGSFPANAHKLFDLSGNVQEWVEDDYSNLGNTALGVLRGGGWTTYQVESLYSGVRNAVPPDFQDVIYGFRVVLAKVPPKGE